MDEQTKDEVLKALRSALRALRSAEKAISRTPSGPAPAPAPVALEPEPAEQLPPAEAALRTFLLDSAVAAKEYEEQDPQSFRVRFELLKPDIQRFVLSKQLYQEGPRGSGAVNFDETDAALLFEKCLKAMTKNEINQAEVLAPFVDQASLRNWGDVDPDNDLVIMRHETPGPVEVTLDEAKLNSLMEAARKVAGAIDRTAVELKQEHMIQWEPTHPKTGQVNTIMYLHNVEAKWAACIHPNEIGDEVVSRLAVIEVDYDNPQHGWWDAARVDRDLPQHLLPIVRNKEKSVLCPQQAVDSIESWAAELPGWYDGTDEHPTPLVFRDAVYDDVL